ncbi:hypothetical protein Tco_1190499 [Tanacetum coccineum]
MAIFVISVSSDSSKESMGTSAGRVILFGTIPTTISDTTPIVTLPTTHVDTILTPTEIPDVSPIVSPSPDYTPTSPDYSLASDTESDPSEDSSSDCIPPLPATSPFLPLTNDSLDSGTPDTPPSPTHDSSSEASSDFHSVASPDSSSRHSSSGHSSLDSPCDSPTTFVGPSRKRHRSSMTSVLVLTPIPEALSPAHADLLPPPKSIRISDSVTDLEVSSDESSESSVHVLTPILEPYLKPDIDLDVQAKNDECIAYADSLRAGGIDARVVVEIVARA